MENNSKGFRLVWRKSIQGLTPEKWPPAPVAGALKDDDAIKVHYITEEQFFNCSIDELILLFPEPENDYAKDKKRI